MKDLRNSNSRSRDCYDARGDHHDSHRGHVLNDGVSCGRVFYACRVSLCVRNVSCGLSYDQIRNLRRNSLRGRNVYHGYHPISKRVEE